jgi:hypothetical protein
VAKPSGISPNALTAVLIIIVLVWAGSFVATLTVDDYTPPVGINEMMIALVGFLFAGRQVASRSDDDDDDDDEPPRRPPRRPPGDREGEGPDAR